MAKKEFKSKLIKSGTHFTLKKLADYFNKEFGGKVIGGKVGAEFTLWDMQQYALNGVPAKYGRITIRKFDLTDSVGIIIYEMKNNGKE